MNDTAKYIFYKSLCEYEYATFVIMNYFCPG